MVRDCFLCKKIDVIDDEASFHQCLVKIIKLNNFWPEIKLIQLKIACLYFKLRPPQPVSLYLALNSGQFGRQKHQTAMLPRTPSAGRGRARFSTTPRVGSPRNVTDSSNSMSPLHGFAQSQTGADDELPDYIMVMVANKRTKSQMNEDLNLFLSTKTSTFVNWLHIVLKKLKEVTVTNPEIYKKVSKRKSDDHTEVKTKKEKRDKKVVKKEEPPDIPDEKPKIKPEAEFSLEPLEERKSLTDDLPIITKSESRKVIVTSNVEVSTTKIVYEDNFDIPLMSEIQDCNEEDLDALEKKIRSVKSRLGLLVESDEENPTTSTSGVNVDSVNLETIEKVIEEKNQRDSLSEENENGENRPAGETEGTALNDSRQISILENEISESHNKELERLTSALEKDENKEEEPEESYTPKRKEITDTDDISPITEQSNEADKDKSSTNRKYPERKHERITFDPRDLSPKESPRKSAKERLGRKSSTSPDPLKRDRRKNSFYAGCEEEDDLRKADPHRDFKEWVALRQRDRSRSREKRDRSRDTGRVAHWERRGRSRERRDRSWGRRDRSWGQRDNRINSWNKGDKSWDRRNKSRDRSRDGPGKSGETRNRSWDRYERTREGRNRSRSLDRRNRSKSREDQKEITNELNKIKSDENVIKEEKEDLGDESKERTTRRKSRSKSRQREPKPEVIQSRMLMSKVSVPEKPPNSDKSDDEQVKREVQSLVKVKRTMRTGRVQPNKNLLLRAVAEAQRSVAQAPKSGILSPKKSKSIQERLGVTRPKSSRVCRLMENEKAKLKSLLEQTSKNQILQRRLTLEGCDSSDGEYVPKPVQSTRNYNNSQGEYVPKSMKKSVVVPKYVPSSKTSPENSEDSDRTPSPKHKFIITLDGIDKIKTELPSTDTEKKDTKNLESRRLTDQQKKTSPETSRTSNEKTPPPKLRVDGRKVPSPIVFSKKEFSNHSAIKIPKPNIPDKLPVVHPPLSIKNKERCKYWPSCRQGDKCEFVHPSQTCEKFPQCRNSDSCLYLHPKCKFGSSCTKKECPYDHNVAKPVLVSKLQVPVQSCKFYPNCTNLNCPFFHPKPCKYGKFCTNITECPFLHNCPPKRSLSWTSK